MEFLRDSHGKTHSCTKPEKANSHEGVDSIMTLL